MNSHREAGDPPIRTIADIEAIERVPLEQRNDCWTVYDLLTRGAAREPGKVALRYLAQPTVECDPQDITYSELLHSTHRAANLLHSLGVGRDDAVAILLPTLPQNYVALLGAMSAGIAFPINWMLQPGQIATLLQAAAVKVLIALAPTPGFDVWEKVQSLPESIRSAIRILWVHTRGAGIEGEPGFDAACQAHPADRLVFQRDADPLRTAAYIHTGGTTGSPKVTRITHRSIAYKCWAYSLVLDQSPGQTMVGVTPLFHIGGIVLRAINPLAAGMTIVVLGPTGFRDKAAIRNFWGLVARHRITDMSGVPTSLGALVDVPVGGADLSSLRPFAVTGSAPLPADIGRRLEERIGVRLLLDYGLTEATATVALPAPHGAAEPGASLRLPYTRLRIARLDKNGRVEQDCPVGDIGEILVAGPGLAAGYLDPALDSALFVEEGWARTGDLGRLDAKGQLWVTGRAKEVIIRGGHNIDPRVIEEALMKHESVALVAAVGQPDAYAGELPVAYVQLKPLAQASAQELMEFARQHIPERAATPVAVFLVDAMPLTGVGKIFKPALRDRALSAAIAAAIRSASPMAVEPLVQVKPHPEHGTLVSVTLPIADSDRSGALEKRIRDTLGRFPYAYELLFQTPA